MIERLEPRNLLTLSFWHVELWTDHHGNPGVEITDNSVVVGEDFWVIIQAEDRRNDPASVGGVDPGIGGASVDVDWHGPIKAVDAIITDSLPLWQETDIETDSAYLRGLSMSSLGAGGPIGGDGPQEFARMRFHGTDEGEAGIQLDIGADGVGMLPYVFTRAPFQHVFEGLPDTRVVAGCKSIPIKEGR